MRTRIVPVITLLLLGLSTGEASPQQSSTQSPHGELSRDLDCSACHTPDGWAPARATMDFEHDNDTDFPLVGRHHDAGCGGCHLGLRFDEPRVSASDCGACHVDVHLGNLSDNCAGCHNEVSYTDVAGLSIHARTAFPLTGTHLQLTCESCHVDDRGGAYSPLDPDCYSCHAGDYESAQSLDHTALGFSTNCQQCHNTLGWGGGPFDHLAASGSFDLIGTHAIVRCEACHVMPGLAPKYQPAAQNDCYACHEQDYQRKHASSGFPTDCLQCHDQTAWDGAVIVAAEHNAIFPIFSGRHEGKWGNDCSVCHTVPNNQQVFSCLNCHEHAQARMNDAHQDVPGYNYISMLCYECHPTGEAD